VVYVELAKMLRHEAAVLAGVLLMKGVWVLVLVDVSFIDSLAAVSTGGCLGLRVS